MSGCMLGVQYAASKCLYLSPAIASRALWSMQSGLRIFRA